ncbi:MAG: Tim44 domain-containing protein [Alphaproteobacteria bacterium]|nr:Tim44 domain-containing protein [Alphaproteobacteria bacterium]
MGDGFHFIDIVFFALVAVFIALRLRSVLGRRDGHEGGYQDPFRPAPTPERRAEAAAGDNVVRLPDRDSTTEQEREKRFAAAAHGDAALAEGLAQVRAADPSFDPDGFLAGARGAFEMILEAFAKGELDSVKNFLAPDVHANFAEALKARAAAGETVESTLVGVGKVEIVEAFVEGRNTVVAVRFNSDQINVTRDAVGTVVSGEPSKVVSVADVWTFQRDPRARDPNWMLIATQSLD